MGTPIRVATSVEVPETRRERAVIWTMSPAILSTSLRRSA